VLIVIGSGGVVLKKVKPLHIDKVHKMSRKNAYVTRRSEFNNTYAWVFESIANDADFGWFVMQFVNCFGRSLAYNSEKVAVEDYTGFYMSYSRMAEEMTAQGYTTTLKTVSRHLPRMIEMGIISRAAVTPHPNSRRIYVLNPTEPHQNDWLAEKVAARYRDESPYKNQASNIEAKKAREAEVVEDKSPTNRVPFKKAEIPGPKQPKEKPLGISYAELCRQLSVDASGKFTRGDDADQARTRVELSLIIEDQPLVNLVNAVTILSHKGMRVTDETWTWALAQQLVLAPEQVENINEWAERLEGLK
jgi:hypothetical protein